MESQIEKLRELMKRGAICMVGAISSEGMSFQPLPLAEVDPMGSLWFFTHMDSVQAEEVREHTRMAVTYSDQKNQVYVSIGGLGLVGDKNREKMKELFNTYFFRWFPVGLDDPGLALMKIRPTDIGFWTQSRDLSWQSVKLLSAEAGPITK